MGKHLPPRPLPASPAPARRPPPPMKNCTFLGDEHDERDYQRRLAAWEAEHGPSGHRITADGVAVVATDFFYFEDMAACPRGVKVVLLGEGGVASIGTYAGEPFWIGWAPLPKRRKGGV